MKRFNTFMNDAGVAEVQSGKYVLYEEAAATIAEKDKEIAELRERNKLLTEDALDCIEVNAILEEQLRASNEALVAAEARISELHECLSTTLNEINELDVYDNGCLILAKSDNLTALAKRDAKRDNTAHTELLEIHKIGMCIAECPSATDTDTATVRMVKEMAFRLNQAEAHDNEVINKLAVWMIYNGIPTGHGDTIDGLLAELDANFKEVRAKALEKAADKLSGILAFNVMYPARWVDGSYLEAAQELHLMAAEIRAEG